MIFLGELGVVAVIIFSHGGDSMHWYYEERGTQVGPLTDDQFQNAVTTGRVGKDTLVWNESLTVWTEYGALTASPPAMPALRQTVAAATQSCSQCGRNFQQQDLIQYGGLMVCAGCKPTFFQRLKEEGRVAAIWRDGKFLVAANGTVLPDRCVKCNAPARGSKMTKKFYWHPPILYLLICAGFLVYAIVALIVRNASTLHMGVCEIHKSKRKRAIAITWSVVGLAIALIIVAAASDTGALAGIGVLLLLGGMIFGLVATQLVVPSRIDKQNVVWLKGVPAEYLEGLPAYRM